MTALRSLVFTILLEEPEFRRMEMRDGERLVTDACQRWQADDGAEMTLAASMRNYVNDVTDHHRCEPGVWQRYVDALKATDEQRDLERRLAEHHQNVLEGDDTITYLDRVDGHWYVCRYDRTLPQLHARGCRTCVAAEPEHQHDCDGCTFLGRFTDPDGRRSYDLYVCPNEPTVIARHGTDGEYLSGLAFVGRIDALTEAHRRAVERGLL